MVRSVLIGGLLAMTACDSTVIVEGTGGGGASAGPSSASSADSASASNATSSSSGPTWTVPPDRVYSYVDCEYQDVGTLLAVEVWDLGAACAPPPPSDSVLVLGIVGWDGQPGTFTVGVETPQGLGLAGKAPLMSDEITGTITVEPFVGTPSGIAWDLSVGAGRTDLSVCGQFDAFPCRE